MHRGELTVRFDNGHSQSLAVEELGADRLDHAYAVTVHRMQGATVDRAHVFADGGGRELAYVAISRANETRIYVVTDVLDQAAEDLTVEWSADRRQRWILDIGEPAIDDRVRRPTLAQRTESSLRIARLRVEREAVQAMAPDAEARLRSLDSRLHLAEMEGRFAADRAASLGRS